MGLLLKFGDIIEIILANDYQFFKFKKKFFYNFLLWVKVKIFFIKNIKIIIVIKFKKYIANICIYSIFIGNFYNKKSYFLLSYLKLIKT